MEKSLTMPKLGATMTEGTVLRWLYQTGDWVEKGEPLVEVMTDKVNIEVEAPISGRLINILVQDGDILPIGTPMGTLVDDTDTSTMTESVMTHSTLQIASTPAAKREAALHGIDLQAVVQDGAKQPLNRNDVIAFVESRQSTSQREDGGRQPVRATPIAQKIAGEHQIDLATIVGRKPGQKVTRSDVEAHLTGIAQQKEVLVEQTESISQYIPSQDTSDEELLPVSPVRQLIGKRMLQSVTSAPHIYLDLEIDMTEAERCRRRMGDRLQAQGEPVPSLTALIVRAAAAAIVLHPEVNATLELGALQGKDAIRRRQAVHIGVAVDTERALLTPVIRNAHQQSLPALAHEIRRLTLAARQDTLKPEDVVGATFTISNLGMYGIDTFHAIIVPGQSAILAVGKVTKRGIVIEDDNGARLEIRPMMKVSLSADHRVLDGARGSRFLQQFKMFLEEPYLLL